MNLLSLAGLPLDERLAIVVAATIVAGFMRGFIGFGSALVIVPVLSLVLGPRAAVAISTAVSFPTMLQLMPETIRHCERPIVMPISLACFAATPFGSWILATTDPGLMKIVISVLLIVMVAMLARGWRLTREVGSGVLVGAGTVGGLIQGSTGLGGPPVVAVALSRPGTARQQRANVLGMMAAISLASLVSLWWFGFFTRQVVMIVLVLLPLYILFATLGSRYFSQNGQRAFRPVALAVLAAIGLGTLLAAIREMSS